MSAHRISPFICAVIASAIAACSGDTSLPTEPANGQALNREAPFYGPSASADGSSGGTQESGGTGGTGQGGVTPTPSASDNPQQPPPAPPPAGPRQRLINDFLLSQGTFCANDGMGGDCRRYMGGGANYISWFDKARGTMIAIDYAGLADAWIRQGGGNSVGTNLFGTISEEPLPDGTARVTVKLEGTNVLAFAKQGPDLFAPSMYGFDTKEVYDPANAPALGNVQMEIVFINDAPGVAIPDLVQLIRSPLGRQRLLSIRLNYTGSGQMRAASGMGEGTKADVFVTFDGSQGAVMPSNPAAPGNTPPTGYVTAQFQPTAVS